LRKRGPRNPPRLFLRHVRRENPTQGPKKRKKKKSIYESCAGEGEKKKKKKGVGVNLFRKKGGEKKAPPPQNLLVIGGKFPWGSEEKGRIWRKGGKDTLFFRDSKGGKKRGGEESRKARNRAILRRGKGRKGGQQHHKGRGEPPSQRGKKEKGKKVKQMNGEKEKKEPAFLTENKEGHPGARAGKKKGKRF